MPPLDLDLRAKDIVKELDAGNLAAATDALREDAGKVDGAQYKKLVTAIDSLDKKGTGIDIVFDKEIFGTVVKLRQKNESDTFERSVSIFDDEINKVATVWDPYQAQKDKFVADSVKEVSAKLDSGDFEASSRALNQMLKYDKSMGYGVLLDALRQMENTDKKGQGCDLTISEIRSNVQIERGMLVSYRLDGYRVSLSQKAGGDSLTREIGTLDRYSAKETWKPPVLKADKEK